MKISLREMVVLVVIVIGTLRATAAPHYVWAGGSDTTPYETWAQAAHTIAAAVAVARSGDTVWVTNGVYTISAEIAVGGGVVLRSWNGNDGNTFIDGNHSTRCVDLIDDGATLDGFVVRNGNDAGSGGGVTLSPGAVLANSSIVSNTAGYGGGVYFAGGGYASNCTIALNRAIGPQSIYAGGGGVYMVDGGTLVDCTVYGNDSPLGPGGGINCGMGSVVRGGMVSNNLANRGGGIACAGQALISNVLIVANTCTNGVCGGGGVSLLYGAKLINSRVCHNKNYGGGGGGVDIEAGCGVSNCVICENYVAANNGGGALLAGGSTLTDSTIMSNRSDRGGGVFASSGAIINCKIRYNLAVNDWGGGGVFASPDGSTFIRGCLISENECVTDYAAWGGGGGVWMANGALLDNCTIVRNRARSNNGGVCWNGGTVKNSILCFNTVGAIATNINAGFTNFYNSCSPDLTAGVNGNIAADPVFLSAGSGSGTNASPGDYALRSTSPCVNQGRNEDWMTRKALDLDGNPRLARGLVDMGAYEHPFPRAWGWKRRK